MADDGRADIVERLRQTSREAQALRSVISRVPDELVWQRPGDSPSIAELLWLIHLADEFRFSPAIDAIARGDEPRIEHVNPAILLGTDPAAEGSIDDILRQVADSRDKLLQKLESVPAGQWAAPAVLIGHGEQTCEDFALSIAEHDAGILKEIGYRLFESNLGG